MCWRLATIWKKSTYKWIWALQTHVSQGSTITQSMCPANLDSAMSASCKCTAQDAALCPIYITCPPRARSHPGPQNKEYSSNTNISKIILHSAFFQDQNAIKSPHLRQFCCSGREKWTAELLLRPDGCWEGWRRKYSCNTVDFVYPPLHFLWTPTRNRYNHVRVFLYVRVSHLAHFSLWISNGTQNHFFFFLVQWVPDKASVETDISNSNHHGVIGTYEHHGARLWSSLKDTGKESKITWQ